MSTPSQAYKIFQNAAELSDQSSVFPHSHVN